MAYNNQQQALEQAGREFVANLTTELLRNDKVSSGALVKSLGYKVIKDTNDFVLELKALSYLQNVNDGRRPGKYAPVDAIKKWVRQKPIKFQGLSEDQTAFLVNKDIYDNGIKPTNILDDALAELEINLTLLLEEASIKDIEDMIIELSKNNN